MSDPVGGPIAARQTPLTAPVPASWDERVTAYLNGELVPVPPRHAATVILLRDRADGPPDVYLLKRAATMAFAGGFYAFPGGRVDPRDAEADIAWAGPAPAVWARRFGSDEAEARSLLCAAVRETFEESGVLFAGTDEHSVVADTTGDDWEADRQGLVSRATSLGELLARRGLVLRTDLLGAWSRWITPEFEPRRYDTAFFVAALPTGQRARDVSGEAEETVWARTDAIIADHEAGTVQMLPPTVTTLREVLPFATAAEALAAAADRPLAPIMPTVSRAADGSLVMGWAS